MKNILILGAGTAGTMMANHLGKMAFKHVYWQVLLRGLPIPMVGHRMQLGGKRIPEGVAVPEPVV